MCSLKLGNFFVKQGENMIKKSLEAEFGKQIGKTAKNGQMAFRRAFRNGTDVITGCDRKGNVIAVVERNLDDLNHGFIRKSVYNNNGDMVKVYNSRIATNFYDNRSYDLNTGHFTRKTSIPGFDMDV